MSELHAENSTNSENSYINRIVTFVSQKTGLGQTTALWVLIILVVLILVGVLYLILHKSNSSSQYMMGGGDFSSDLYETF